MRRPPRGTDTFPVPPPTPTDMTPEQLMATMGEKGWTTHRTLDPVRAAALHEAVRAVSWDMDDAERHAAIIATAERFEAWLAGPEAT